MPASERNEPIAENELKDEKGLKSKSASSKTKDLSHVPCKFYKVGGCTAGSACPFSHAAVEPGAQRDVCTWFVKGNCKFGHKCALAHVLPGQPMSMDRKNKKAAQQAGGGGGGGGKDKGGQRVGNKRDSQSGGAAGGGGRNPLFGPSGPGGSTSRSGQGRPPIQMSLKATMSAPAPALKDTDFAEYGVLDEDKAGDASPVAVAKTNSSSTEDDRAAPSSVEKTDSVVGGEGATSATPPQPITGKSASPFPMSPPRNMALSPRNAPNEFGPIGSPPNSGHLTASPRHRNGVGSPGTSPSVNGILSSPPFANGPRSLGSGLTIGGIPRRPTPNIVGGSIPRHNGFPERERQGSGEGGDDFEDFIPSSLTDLLTPEERNRRMSRSNSGQHAGSVGAALLAEEGANGGNGHRYSRSVPAPSLLGDMKSIWTDNKSPAPPTGGTPGSFTSGSPFAAQEFGSFGGSSNNGHLLSLSPSNASAAFLSHGHLHSQFASKQGLGRGIRNTSNPLMPIPSAQAPSTQRPGHSPQPGSHSGSGSGTGTGGGFLSANPTQMTFGETALQAHAPGQSLPQGLAAGYSRMHAMPSSPNNNNNFNPTMSPTSVGFSGISHSPGVNSLFPSMPYGGPAASPHASSPLASSPLRDMRAANQNVHIEGGGTEGGAGAGGLLSKMSYSMAAGRPNTVAQRNVSGPQRGGPPPGIMSPLARPQQQDDDDLFHLDE